MFFNILFIENCHQRLETMSPWRLGDFSWYRRVPLRPVFSSLKRRQSLGARLNWRPSSFFHGRDASSLDGKCSITCHTAYLAPNDFHLLRELKTSLEDSASTRPNIFKASRTSIPIHWQQPSVKRVLEKSFSGMTNVSIFTVTFGKVTLTYLVIKPFCYSHLSLF